MAELNLNNFFEMEFLCFVVSLPNVVTCHYEFHRLSRNNLRETFLNAKEFLIKQKTFFTIEEHP